MRFLLPLLICSTALAQPTLTKTDDAPEARSLGIIRTTQADGTNGTHASAALVGPDLAITVLDMVDQAASATFKLPCCDEMKVLGIVGVDEKAHTALLKLDTAGRDTAPISLSDEVPTTGGSWLITIGSVEGQGVLSGTYEIRGIRDWPVEGTLVWTRMPFKTLAGGGLAMDSHHRLRALCIGGGSNNSSLFSLITPAMTTPGELIPLDKFSAREPSPLIRARRLSEKGMSGDGTDPIADLTEALKLEPSLWRTQWYVGVLLHQAGRPDEALIEFDKAVKLTPWYAEPLYSTGLVHLRSDRFDQAVTWMDKTVAADPQYGNAWGMKAWSLYKLDRKDEAIAAGEEALKVSDDWNHYNNQVVMLREMGRHPDAIDILRRYCRKHPDKERGWSALSAELERAHDEAGAEKALRDGLEHVPGSVMLHRLLAAALGSKDDLPGTLAELKKVIELDPDAKDIEKLKSWVKDFEEQLKEQK